MLSKIGYNFTKTKFGRKIWSEVYLLLLLYINRPTTKKLLTKRILKTIDFSVRNLGEVEYDKPNWLQHQKSKFGRIIRSEVYLLLPLCINRSIKKYFPIETIPERTDSSIRNLGKDEYDKQNWLQQHVAKLRSRWLQWIFRTFLWFTTSGCTRVLWCCNQFCLSYSTFRRSFMLESIISKSVSIRKFLVTDWFMYSGNRR